MLVQTQPLKKMSSPNYLPNKQDVQQSVLIFPMNPVMQIQHLGMKKRSNKEIKILPSQITQPSSILEKKKNSNHRLVTQEKPYQTDNYQREPMSASFNIQDWDSNMQPSSNERLINSPTMSAPAQPRPKLKPLDQQNSDEQRSQEQFPLGIQSYPKTNPPLKSKKNFYSISPRLSEAKTYQETDVNQQVNHIHMQPLFFGQTLPNRNINVNKLMVPKPLAMLQQQADQEHLLNTHKPSKKKEKTIHSTKQSTKSKLTISDSFRGLHNKDASIKSKKEANFQPYLQAQQTLQQAQQNALPARFQKQQQKKEQPIKQMPNVAPVSVREEKSEENRQETPQVKEIQQLPLIEKPPRPTPIYKFQIIAGNNARMIKNVLVETRNEMWYETPTQIDQYRGTYSQPQVSHFHLRWAPTSKGINFDRLSQNLFTQMVNHFEGHHEISTKNKLFKNICAWHDQQGQIVFKDMLPLTFCLKIELQNSGEVCETSFASQISNFEKSFTLLEQNQTELLTTNTPTEFGTEVGKNFTQKSNQPILMPKSHFAGKNVWILKPTGLNRGKGIHLVASIEEAKQIIRQTCIDNHTPKQQPQIQPQHRAPQKPKTQQKAEKADVKKFVIQKYVEKPFLMEGRKFDIRVYVLVNQDMNLYFFREGYLRMTSAQYNLDNIQDEYVHLTNNAIQRNCKEYGSQEDGNQLSFADLRSFLRREHPNVDFDRDILPTMKYQSIISLQSVYKKLNQQKRKHCFELFGLDFMLDQDLNCLLIEYNTNPCLEETSRLLQVILPRMVDDLFKLTIDQVFYQTVQQPDPRFEVKDKQGQSNLMNSVLKQRQQMHTIAVDIKYSEHRPSPFRVPGYKDSFNLWEKLCDLKEMITPNKADYYNVKLDENKLLIELQNSTQLRIVEAKTAEENFRNQNLEKSNSKFQIEEQA